MSKSNIQVANQTNRNLESKVNLTKESKEAFVSGVRMVGNLFRAGEHGSGIVADKLERLREQIAISDTIEHNRLITQLHQEAEEAGINLK